MADLINRFPGRNPEVNEEIKSIIEENRQGALPVTEHLKDILRVPVGTTGKVARDGRSNAHLCWLIDCLIGWVV